MEREHQKIKATRMIASLKQIKQEDQIVVNTFNLANMMRRTRRWRSHSLTHTHTITDLTAKTCNHLELLPAWSQS